jgi:hypothetical protein
MELTRENVRAEATRRGLSFRKLMDLYYRQDPERATHLSLYWKVAPRHPEKLFGKSRVGQFVGDIRKFLAEAGIRLTAVQGEDHMAWTGCRSRRRSARLETSRSSARSRALESPSLGKESEEATAR